MSSKDKIAFARYEVYKKRLQAILKQKNPQKINAVDALLRKYRGKEHGVYAKVCSKYGITPKPEWSPNNNINRNKPMQQIKSKKLPSKCNNKQTDSRQNKMKNKLSALKNKKLAKGNRSKIVKKTIPQIEKKKIVIQKQEESEDEYEDDFEDYSDDFEAEEKEEKEEKSVLMTKHNIRSSKTNILFSMRERSIDQQYLKRVGKEIYCRGIQSFYVENMQTQTTKKKKENKSTQYEFCEARNKDVDLNYDRQRLQSFVNKSCKLIHGLLSFKNRNSANNEKKCNDDSFLSEGITFVSDEFKILTDRSINDITFSVRNPNIIAVAYSKLQINYDPNRDDEKMQDLNINIKYDVDVDGLVCIWDKRKHLLPIYALICDDEIKTIQFLPNEYDNFIICGRQNGCIAVWDLSETNGIHQKYKIDDQTALYLRYPSYMTDCQWNRNHHYPIICLQFLNKSEFCSVDINGLINGWSIDCIANSQINESKSRDLCCRDMDTIKINQQFTFDIASHIYGNNLHSLQSGCCLCAVPMQSNETRMLFAYKSCVYMLWRIGPNVEIIEEYTLKYDVIGINHANNNVISVAVCDAMFVAGYENGMICLFNMGESYPIRRFYDMNNIQSVQSVSFMKIDQYLLLYAMFKDGRIRFVHIKGNKDIQTHIFEKILPTNHKSIKSFPIKPCCKSVNSFIAITNNNTFSIHRINMRNI